MNVLSAIASALGALGTNEIATIATALGALGTLATLIWAVMVYNKDRHDKQVAQFRNDIVNIVTRYEEMMTLFQDNIVLTCRSIFNFDRPESKRIYKKAINALNMPDEASFNSAKAAMSDAINECVLYSIDADIMSQSDKPRLACYATLQSIRSFLPVMYEYIETSGEFVMHAYHNELGVNNIRKYMHASLSMLWRAKRNGNIRIDHELDLIIAWRNVLSSHMNQLNSTVCFADVFNEASSAIKTYSELYLREDNKALWAAHKKEMCTDLKVFGAATRTGLLINIVKWKLGKKDPDIFTTLVQSITRLEEKVGK